MNLHYQIRQEFAKSDGLLMINVIVTRQINTGQTINNQLINMIQGLTASGSNKIVFA